MDFNRKNALSITCCLLACFYYYYYFRHSEDDYTKNVHQQKCHQEFLHKDAKSAMNRTKTEQCKKEIFEVACKNSQSLYPEFIQSQCNIEIKPEDIKKSYIGCFQDSFEKRILDGYKGSFKDQNSPQACFKHCAQLGYDFAGVQYSYECFCGNKIPNPDLKIDEKKCDLPCSGGDHQIDQSMSQNCGGYLTMNIYNLVSKQEVISSMKSSNYSDVRVSYLFVVHRRGLRQILRLFKLLYDEKDYFYFHVDQRDTYLYR